MFCKLLDFRQRDKLDKVPFNSCMSKDIMLAVFRKVHADSLVTREDLEKEYLGGFQSIYPHYTVGTHES